MLLEEQEKSRVKGLIINKFRGDVSILEPGIQMLEEKGGIPVCGVVPYMKVQLEDEDSLTGKFKHRKEALIDLAVIRYPRISNFTDVYKRQERRQYIKNAFPCIADCEMCGLCTVFRGKDPELAYADYISGKRSYLEVSQEYR